MKNILVKVKNVISNFVVLIESAIYGRSSRNILFGSWGGDKFADNSRFLFQYLHENRDDLGINHVVWATRSNALYNDLVKLGYEVCLIGTKYSKKWHLKSGIHIICNMKFSSKRFPADIDTKYSFGAKKVQLWHGVGVKAIGRASKQSIELDDVKPNKSRIYELLKTITTEGGWYNEYFLCTSELNKRINYITNDCRYNRMFISSYPRNCDTVTLLENEIEVVSQIKRYKYCIMYLPTFRSDYSNYTHPLQCQSFQNYLHKNNIGFIEKPHSASTFSVSSGMIPNVIYLPKSFDINVLYKYCGCVISDYSSAVFDGIYRKMPTIVYVPDLEEFKSGDVGLLVDIEEYFNGIITKSVDECIQALNRITEGAFFDENISRLYAKVRNEFYSNRETVISDIWKDILKTIN